MAVLDDLIQAVQDNAGLSRRADEHGNRLITAVIGPATSRPREARGLHPDITVDDITMFVRMTVTAGGEESRAKAIDMLLSGVICPIAHDTVDSGQT